MSSPTVSLSSIESTAQGDMAAVCADPTISQKTKEAAAFWANGIHDLVYVVQRIEGAIGSSYQGDETGEYLNIGAAGGKLTWYGRDKFPVLGTKIKEWQQIAVGSKILPTATFIVDITMVVIAMVDMTNGFVPPDSGTRFSSGSDKFETVYADLELAAPDPRDWDGQAAQAYADQNTALQARVQQMQDLDQQMQGLIASQAQQVEYAHTMITWILCGLIFAQGLALWLYTIPKIGADLSLFFQASAAVAAVVLVGLIEEQTHSMSQDHADSIDKIAEQYDAVADGKSLVSPLSQPTVRQAEETRVGSFLDLVSSPSELSAFPTVPAMAALASLIPYNTFGENRAFFGVPAPPVSATAMPGRAAKPFGPTSPHTSPRIQTPMAREVGATAGVSTTKRAPVDVAFIGAQRTHDPSSLQPML